MGQPVGNSSDLSAHGLVYRGELRRLDLQFSRLSSETALRKRSGGTCPTSSGETGALPAVRYPPAGDLATCPRRPVAFSLPRSSASRSDFVPSTRSAASALPQEHCSARRSVPEVPSLAEWRWSWAERRRRPMRSRLGSTDKTRR